MKYTLRTSGWLDDWYILEGGINWSCIEGPAEDWKDIIRGIETHNQMLNKRCAVRPRDDEFVFWSPRNCSGSGDSDKVVMTQEEATQFAKLARIVIEWEPEPVNDFDPIYSGA